MEQGRQESHKKQLRFLFPSIATNHSEPLMLVRGTGLHLYDAEGREYLDFPGGNDEHRGDYLKHVLESL